MRSQARTPQPAGPNALIRRAPTPPARRAAPRIPARSPAISTDAPRPIVASQL
ncbi:hypothetical protein HYPSUDRAFT_39750 [Hypholoma sublateritium FD-334 SS-4]|uniref:Uncharacterized protein n=1 Tax=Hypholoma sublateritium (strain FD-334 SS-4) TaxID=945553 RepID=A0A0D2PVI6_HYPSF|nr:hypothetical protein HYPSUDRAFT_39750 [Hypholoma sublateritium FD-334 SS-4]